MSPARREAWLAHTREQLFAPVHHLVESCTWLRADAAEAAGELTADLDRLRSNALKLRHLVGDLLADDNLDNRELLTRWLARELHQVVAVEDGNAALAALRRAGPEPFDLVLLDILMPGKNGYQVLQEIKADAGLRDLPVVMISALGAME